MNTMNIRIRLYIIKSLDWLLLLVVLGVGIPAMFLAEHNRGIYAIAVLIGLALINRVGGWSLNKIAELQYTLEQAQKKNVAH